jgi:ribosomal protein S18 acetylase RimI-like enzyme
LPFRLATEADLPALVELQRDFYVLERIAFDDAAALQSMRTLVSDHSLGRLIVIEDDGAIAGFLSLTFGFTLEYHGRNAFLDELYLAPHARDRGLGTEALRVAEEICVEAGVKVLQLEVDRWNDRARALYHRRGFVDHDRHLMAKRL